jgi:hypothetical protein
MKRRGVQTLMILVVLLICLFMLWLLCMGATFQFEAIITLAFGWTKYLLRVIPQLNPNPWSVVSALACLICFTCGAHAFLRWLYRAWGTEEESGSIDKKSCNWPWKRTLQLVGLVVLMFVSGIAMTGMVHQTGWLIRSPELLTTSRSGAHRIVSTNNLKQISLAAQSYHDNQTAPHLPQSTFDATGRPMHSWQTAILPYIEYGNIYNQIDQSKPWSDPVNMQAMAAPVKPFLHPSLPYEPSTGFATSHYAGNVQILLGDTPKKLSDFPHGTSNTILAGEASSNFRAWGDPLNVRDPRNGAAGQPNGFGGPNGKPALFGMLDGSVRVFDPKELAELVGRVPE